MQAVIAAIQAGIATQGYYYQKQFGEVGLCLDQRKQLLLELAEHFGSVLQPPGGSIVQTEPKARAHPSRAFDHGAAIGWHNDFSTLAERPRLSFSYIAEADPLCPTMGSWRLACVGAILAMLRSQADGPELIAFMKQPIFPFAYKDSARVAYYPLLAQEQLRWYKVAMDWGLRKGDMAKDNRVRYQLLRKRILECANAVGELCEGVKGALMVAHNGLALHDRLQQTVGGEQPVRRALLCFVD